MPRDAAHLATARFQRLADGRRGRRQRVPVLILAALLLHHGAELLELRRTRLHVFQQAAIEFRRRFQHRFLERLQRDRALLDPLRPLVRIGKAVQIDRAAIIGQRQRAAASRGRDRNAGDRRQDHSVALLAVEPRQRRRPGGQALLVGQRIQVVPKRLGQLAHQAETIPQTRIAMLAHQGLAQPGRDLKILRFLGNGLGSKFQQPLPMRPMIGALRRPTRRSRPRSARRRGPRIARP